MAGIYRGMVDDAKVLLTTAVLISVQRTRYPYAESSSIYDDTWRGYEACRRIRHEHHLPHHASTQRSRDVRVMATGIAPGEEEQAGRLIS